jgi:hypothetical protein
MSDNITFCSRRRHSNAIKASVPVKWDEAVRVAEDMNVTRTLHSVTLLTLLVLFNCNTVCLYDICH